MTTFPDKSPGSDVTVRPSMNGLTSEQSVQAAALLARVAAVDGRAPDGLPNPGTPAWLATCEYSAGAETLPAGAETPLVGAGAAPAGTPTVLGVAWRPDGDPAELYVHPDYRGRGIGRRLARAVIADGPVWAHGTLAAAQHLADSLRARPTRRLLQLRRDNSPGGDLLEVDPPVGTTIRTFRPGEDEKSLLAVNGRAFAWHPEQGRLDAAGLAEEMSQSWFDSDGLFVAVAAGHDDVPDGTLIGFHWTKVHDLDTPPIGEVYVIGVDPRSPVRHVGTPLLAVGLNHLAAQGLSQTMLYVEADNERALALYERYGFTTFATDTVFDTSPRTPPATP